MRKLVLFGLLGGVFGLALLLERVFSSEQAAKPAKLDEFKVVATLGGGPPRTIPAEPPEDMASRSRTDDPIRENTALARERTGFRDGADPKSPPATGRTPRTHRVAKGETLSSIARSTLGSSARWKDLARWNGIDDPATLREGMTLHLESPETRANARESRESQTAAAATEARTHTLAKGETLSKLAARYLGSATRWREIQSLNAISDPASLAVGTTLRIPER